MPDSTNRRIGSRNGRDAESFKKGIADHLKYTLGLDPQNATIHDKYLAVAYAVRDRLIEGWIETQQEHREKKVKRVYYLSLEFLIGRLLRNSIVNLGSVQSMAKALQELDLNFRLLEEQEPDAGLGNGGLGRLAACFMESLATLQIPTFGYGIRYDYGIFRQKLSNGYQVEEPDEWLAKGNPWEIPRPDSKTLVQFGGRVIHYEEDGVLRARWIDTYPVIGMPYDTPIDGYGNDSANTLRLWSAHGTEEFDLEDFNQGDYVGAVESKVHAQTLTRVLYPNDSSYSGRELRFKQQYFFVACSVTDMIRRFKRTSHRWDELPDQVAIQLNDTHPALVIPELMRILIDLEGLSWEQAWDLTVKCTAYTNHTLLPEALEKWPVEMFERLLPRHLEIIYLINEIFLKQVTKRFPSDFGKLGRMSLVEEGPNKKVRMANLCMVGTHSTNGVAQLHTQLLCEKVVPDFYQMFPERFNAKTNGVTPRRWLLACNPDLAALITSRIGTGWITHLDELSKLKPMVEEPEFIKEFQEVKEANKAALSQYLKSKFGFTPLPDSIFDVQVKRLHEYKRQLMNALHIIVLYNRIRKNGPDAVHPRTFLFGAKAAPAYHMAKLIIKFINNVGEIINSDPATNGALKVYFVPNYGVSLAEKLIPATDISEQISLAGKEASGTGNMKFMMNGAITVGTLDGANVEMQEEVGAENILIFGLTAKEAEGSSHNYNPRRHYEQDPEIKAAIDLVGSGHFDLGEGGLFMPILDHLLNHDPYMILADLRAYADAQTQAETWYRDPKLWYKKAAMNVACSGKFSSDRTIQEYAREIWNIAPCPIDLGYAPNGWNGAFNSGG
ncbi:MAG: glycogen/starch/alpha-glucan phosphorylase [Verrucomicrobiota bacterium]|nr:glycogen/starch/alpha-glucan phosphorylase [Verrucomicrobiota bacterium]